LHKSRGDDRCRADRIRTKALYPPPILKRETGDAKNPALLGSLQIGEIGLQGRIPLDVAMTEAGAREVETLLKRIEYGILA